MKVYAVVPVNFSYNDEWHYPEGFNKPTEAFRERANAEARAAELTAKAKKEWELRFEDEDQDSPYYVVQEVEVPDAAAPDEPKGESPYQKAQRLKAKAAKAAASDAFKAGAAELFERHPLLESFGFTAYTCYFADGDPCTFSVYADEPWVNGARSYDNKDCSDGFEWQSGKGRVKVGEPGPLAAAADDISKFVYSFDQDDIEAMFGDHVKVTATYDRAAKKVEVKTADHSHHD